MQTKKGVQNRYAALLVWDVTNVQTAHLKTKFELAPASLVAEKTAGLTNQALRAWEEDQGQKRLKPGELLLEQDGQPLVLPLLAPEAVERLRRGTAPKAVRRELEMLQYRSMQQVQPEAGIDDLWRILSQTELPLKRGAHADFLPESPLSPGRLNHRAQTLAGEIPSSVLEPVTRTLVDEWGLRPAQAEGMVALAAKTYARCCPRLDELEPGQMVWLAHGTRKTRRTDPRLFAPVILTLLAPEELESAPANRVELKQLKTRQIERLTTEAWRQDGVPTSLDLEWILGISPTLIRELLEAYQERFGVLLPTAGTVLDMGRTLTHKTIVVELALSGLTTQEIARRIYHTPEAVDNYLRLFERVLLLRYYKLPVSVMIRVTGHGKALLEEHLALVEKHFPNEEALVTYLGQRDVTLEKSS
ncbi:MAG: DUF1670 domain-containing protein [Bacillota bacterium]